MGRGGRDGSESETDISIDEELQVQESLFGGFLQLLMTLKLAIWQISLVVNGRAINQ